jgi:RNA polymerase sigma-70 factor, ECF subfamily
VPTDALISSGATQPYAFSTKFVSSAARPVASLRARNQALNSDQAEQFALLWVGAQSTVAAFIRSLVPDFQQAEDVLQRVAVTLVRKFDQYDVDRPFGAWAIGVAKFEVLYFRRERATDRLVFDDEIVERVALSYQRFAGEADPFREALERCLGNLDGRSKTAIELRYAAGLNSPAVAARMQLSPGAVRMLLSRARQALRQCIEQRVRTLKGT